MPSHILHLQTPLECLKESYPSTRLVSKVPLRVFGCIAYVHSFGPNQIKFTPRAQACVFVGYPPYQRGYKCFHPPSRKYFVTIDVTFCEDRPYFPVSHLQGESVSEESNDTFEFIEPTRSTVYDIDPHPIILPTNQVPWKTYYRRNLRKKVGSPTNQSSAPVQDFEPPRDQGMENPTEPCTNNTMGENDRSDAAVLENMEEKNHGDETEVRIETSNDEAEQGHTRKHDEYAPFLDLPIALRKGTRSCTKHSISNYVSYKNLSPQFRAFTASLDSTTIPKNIYIALECPEWKNAVMEEMKALEKNNTWEICALPKGHKLVGCKWVFTLKYKADETLDRHKARFTTFVKSQGYSQGHSDHTLFTKVSEAGKIAVLIVYVDYIVLFGDDQTEISQLKQRMGMLGCRPADTPIKFNCKLGNSDDQVPADKEQYQHLMGKLIYLSHTRPDISFAVSAVSQFMQAPYEEHMEVVKRILKYLKTTSGKGKSTTGYCTFVWGNLVTCRSKKQNVVSRSSAEAEYRAMSLGISAISIANNPVQHDRTKHVEIDRHFIKERLDSGSICIPYILSSQQVADVLTKGLLKQNFDFCVSKLGLIDIYVPT
ncbi:reverse transcriptase [Cucumis melo var. makuwa]|uniref:Reverse transcriptase n=1 Tax=Cucumis melo var. makuwa TaxID=1194695 RepID=A0A5D3BG80_CUCMM|nr:reverse transcriptase [Cucumis melo var. makuwa]